MPIVADVDSHAHLDSTQPFDLHVMLDDGTILGVNPGRGIGYWRRASLILKRNGYDIPDTGWPKHIKFLLDFYGPGNEWLIMESVRMMVRAGTHRSPLFGVVSEP